MATLKYVHETRPIQFSQPYDFNVCGHILTETRAHAPQVMAGKWSQHPAEAERPCFSRHSHTARALQPEPVSLCVLQPVAKSRERAWTWICDSPLVPVRISQRQRLSLNTPGLVWSWLREKEPTPATLLHQRNFSTHSRTYSHAHREG